MLIARLDSRYHYHSQYHHYHRHHSYYHHRHHHDRQEWFHIIGDTFRREAVLGGYRCYLQQIWVNIQSLQSYSSSTHYNHTHHPYQHRPLHFDLRDFQHDIRPCIDGNHATISSISNTNEHNEATIQKPNCHRRHSKYSHSATIHLLVISACSNSL